MARNITCDSCGIIEPLEGKLHKPSNWVKITLTWKHVGSTGRPSKVLYREVCATCAEKFEGMLGEGGQVK
jgi:hypothetical protein